MLGGKDEPVDHHCWYWVRETRWLKMTPSKEQCVFHWHCWLYLAAQTPHWGLTSRLRRVSVCCVYNRDHKHTWSQTLRCEARTRHLGSYLLQNGRSLPVGDTNTEPGSKSGQYKPVIRLYRLQTGPKGNTWKLTSLSNSLAGICISLHHQWINIY